MSKYEAGDLVCSVAGHDKNEFYIVYEVQKIWVSLVDGKYKLVTKPKMKKCKHVERIKKKVMEIKPEETTDLQIKHCLKVLRKSL